MNVGAIGPVLLPMDGAQSLQPNAPARTFPAWLDEQIRVANQDIVAADGAIRRLAVGEPVNLHQVMVQLEHAKLQFELVLQVRNKLLEAYQDLLRMQI
jgi:flagellar hook-basal body complex protein FliE